MQVEWYEHPKYVRVRERLISSLTNPHYRFRRSEPIIFLCGGEKSTPRDTLAAYLHKHIPTTKFFYAEPVWEVIASRIKLGALAMEADLAKLADLVIVIVESPGTFAELGAFSNSDALRPKLLAIVDAEYSPPQNSFIALGPIHWIEAESNFAPTIYVPLASILTAVGEIEERLSRIKTTTAKVSNLADSPKQLLLFICDLIAIIYPATIETVESYCQGILSEAPSTVAVATVVALGKAMGILGSFAVANETYFFPSTSENAAKPYHHMTLATLPGLRSEHLSALLSIPAARHVMEQIRGKE
ncbi:retron St85 family effector protein [Tunturiibacter gelidoferens]|uniref:Uncharacterized protein n=1 Tax=Tunturiibacter gelidiferens TaxID=3069689 RepID=A0A9X0QD34_9BACT|nr:retron St85 family effector protein [Edaphobacter lichenicola]MBB5328128.1 hypothetical protein [Edaphobacter lichenicola]